IGGVKSLKVYNEQEKDKIGVEPYAMEARVNMEEKEPDTEAWKELCTSFLKVRKRDTN
nr:gamma-glutamyl peptidase 5-like [Tanacetum cinerariifolium]